MNGERDCVFGVERMVFVMLLVCVCCLLGSLLELWSSRGSFPLLVCALPV
jgi:hypothetical protein